MKRICLFCFGLFLSTAWCIAGAATRPAQAGLPQRPVAAITHVMIVSIDGCRPDLLLRADTPTIHSLLPRASFTFWARNDPRSRHIPWIAFGPGIRQNLDLTTFGNLTIDTEDTFCTACYLLEIPAGNNLDGKPIEEIVQREELLVGQ